MRETNIDQSGACPCGSGRSSPVCCGALLDEHGLTGTRLAATAEALMRSRYTAFVRRDAAYLLGTWHPTTRPRMLDFDPRQRWLGLQVIATRDGAASDTQGTVEFVARYKVDGKGHRLHEISRFVQSDGGWLYIDGVRGPTDSTSRLPGASHAARQP